MEHELKWLLAAVGFNYIFYYDNEFLYVSNTNTGLRGQYIPFDFVFTYCGEPDMILVIEL